MQYFTEEHKTKMFKFSVSIFKKYLLKQMKNRIS